MAQSVQLNADYFIFRQSGDNIIQLPQKIKKSPIFFFVVLSLFMCFMMLHYGYEILGIPRLDVKKDTELAKPQALGTLYLYDQHMKQRIQH